MSKAQTDTTAPAEPAPVPRQDQGAPAVVPQPLFVGAVPVEWVRVECIKAALEMRAAQTPARSVIAQAKEFEAYVLGHEPEAR